LEDPGRLVAAATAVDGSGVDRIGQQRHKVSSNAIAGASLVALMWLEAFVL